MSATPSPHDQADRAQQRGEDAQYYREVLHRLIAMGTDLAEAIHRRATAQPGPEARDQAPGQPPGQPVSTPAVDHTVAFDRVARTVRRTVALAHKLSEPDRAPGSTAERAAAQRFHQRRLDARRRIIGAVEDTIQRHADGAEPEVLLADLRERLDDPELGGDVEELLVADIIAAICRDLGLAALPDTHPWTPRAPQTASPGPSRAAQPLGSGTADHSAAAPPANPDPRPASPPRFTLQALARGAWPGTDPPSTPA